MAAPTLAVLRGIIDLAVGDSEITDAEINSAINEAILACRADLVVPIATSSPVAATTVAVPSGFAYIAHVELGGERLPKVAWSLRDGTSPLIVFNLAYFGGAAPSGTLVVSGYKMQEILSADGDALLIDPGFIEARALATLHASRGGTNSDLAQWHQNEHTKWANIAEQRYAKAEPRYGPPVTAVKVMGTIGAA